MDEEAGSRGVGAEDGRGASGSDQPQSILIRTPNWLGDLLVSTAFIQAVLRYFPRARVDLVVRKGFEILPLPHRGTVLPFDRHATSAGTFGAGLRAAGYSHFFVLPPSFSAAWMAFRSGVAHRPGYRGQGRGWLLRPALSHRHRPRSVHIGQEYLDLLAPFLPSTSPPILEDFPAHLELSPEWRETHRPPVPAQGEPYIVLAPGAEYGPAKQWPTRHYAATARALAARGWRMVVAGLPQDRPLGDAILAGAPGGLNLCGDTDLPGMVALVAGASLLISNDSGAMHVGAALGLPQIALFGSTNPHWTAPLNPRAELLTRNEPCAPCYARTCPLKHLNCLEQLEPALVIEKAEALLGASPPHS